MFEQTGSLGRVSEWGVCDGWHGGGNYEGNAGR